jgi:hypothetical protein
MAIEMGMLLKVLGPMAVQILGGLKGTGVDVGDLLDTDSGGGLQILKDIQDQEKAGFTDRENIAWVLDRFLKWDRDRIRDAMYPPGCTCVPGAVDPPGPSDPPEPEPPAPPPELVDAVDPRSIRVLDGSAAEAMTWPVVSPLTVSVSGGRMTYNYSYNPDRMCNVSGKQLAGNFWIGRQVGSQWIMAPFEWFYAGQKWAGPINWSDPGHSVDGGFHAPHPGENLIFMISGCARCGARSAPWRTAICRGVWGG